MSDYSTVKATFQSGEISPYFGGRTDSQIYATGCQIMQNALPHTLGGFRKRPGTVYFASPTNAHYRLIEWFTDTDSFLLLMSAGHFYLMDSTATSPATLAHTTNSYSAADIDDIKFRANKGIMYFVHHSYKPAKLTVTISGGIYTLSFSDISFVTDASNPDRCITFSTAGNYPSAITFKGGRLFLGATDNEPTTTFASRTPSGGNDRYNDFSLYDASYSRSVDTTVDATKTYYTYADGVYTEVSSPTGNPYENNYYEKSFVVLSSNAFSLQENDMYGTKILWYIVQGRLICGTARSVFMDNGQAATPETFDLAVTLNTGASATQAKAFKNYACYCDANGKGLNLILWNEDSQGYVPALITQTAYHQFIEGIKDFEIMLDPESIIWVLTNDNRLLSCVIDGSTGVTGWSEHPRSAGVYTSICMTGTSHKRLFLEVKETISGVDKYHLEYFEMLKDEELENVFYADCATKFSLVSASKKIEVNAALAGHSVTGFCDNGIMPTKTATIDPNDQKVYVTYDTAVSSGYIGLPITTKIKTFAQDLPANGTSQGKKRRIGKITIRTYLSFGGKVGVSEDNLVPLLTRRYGVYEYGTPVELNSDDIVAEVSSKNTKDGSVYVVHDEPAPLNLLSLITKYELLEV